MNTTPFLRYGLPVILLVGVLVGGLWYADRAAAPKRLALTELAQCLTEKGVTFYGAFWCPQCGIQKAIFESAAKDLPYIECSTPDRQAQIQVCQDEKIERYPTWVFPDGKRCTGTLSPEVLAHQASCPLPIVGTPPTAEELYNSLVVSKLTQQLNRTGVSDAEREEQLTKVRDSVDAVLLLWYKTKLEEATDLNHVLAAIIQVLHPCTVEEPV